VITQLVSRHDQRVLFHFVDELRHGGARGSALLRLREMDAEVVERPMRADDRASSLALTECYRPSSALRSGLG
jgi:hypothetical protein